MATIYKRGRVWYSDLYINGKNVRKPLARDKRIAEEKLAELIKDRESARYGFAQKNISWPDFRKKYLEYSQGNKQGSTPRRDLAAIVALEGYFRPRTLDQLTPERLEGLITYRKANGKGHATINRDISAIKAMLKKAVAWGYLKTQNWSAIKDLKTTPGRLRFFTVPELKHLLLKCRTVFPRKAHTAHPYDWVTIGMLAARAGLRLSEIHWLAWGDIDFERGTLSITPKKGWDPKDYEQRHIPIPGDLRSQLKALKRPTEWVLGDRPSIAVMSAYFRKIVRRAGLKGSLHTLRHTYASHLVQNGVSLYVVQKLLGHAGPEMTQRYAHLSPDALTDAVKHLPRL